MPPWPSLKQGLSGGARGPSPFSDFVDQPAWYGVDDPLDERLGQRRIIPLVDGDIALLAVVQDMLVEVTRSGGPTSSGQGAPAQPATAQRTVEEPI